MDFYRDRYGIIRGGNFKAVRLYVPSLVALLKKTESTEGYRIVEDGLPEDAKVVRTDLQWLGPVQVLFMIMESEEWEYIGETDPIPLLSPSVKSSRKKTQKGATGAKKKGRGGVFSDDDRPPFGPGSDEDPDTFPAVEDEPELPI